MGQKAWIRRSLSKDGIKTEEDSDEKEEVIVAEQN